MRRCLMTLIVMLGVAVLFSACAPVYEKTYRYEPPEAMRGQTCVSQCQQSKKMCARITTGQTETDLNCKADYDACYQLCGGQLVEEKQCVDHCEQVI